MTSVDRTAELAARREGWHAQQHLRPRAERRLWSGRSLHQVTLICSDVEQPGLESIGSAQHTAVSVDPAELEQINGRPQDKGVACLGPDRGVTASIYVEDSDGIQIDLIAEPLLSMDGRGLGE